MALAWDRPDIAKEKILVYGQYWQVRVTGFSPPDYNSIVLLKCYPYDSFIISLRA